MTRCSELILNPDFRLRMLAVRRAWAHEWRKEMLKQDSVWAMSYCKELSAANFEAARERLQEVRHARG